MHQIVKIEGGSAVTTSFIIALGVRAEHKAVIQLVRHYISDFEEFGRVAFEMRPFDTAGGTQKREEAILNEQQATLLLSYMRNSDIVREFKKALVKAFYEAMRKPVLPSYQEALRQLADQLDINASQQILISQQKPAVEFVERYVESTGSKGFREVCKLLNAKENEFREFLLSKKIMQRIGGSLMPMAAHQALGRFEVKTGNGENDHAFMQAKFTPKGIQWVAGLWAAHLIQD